jgi:2-C-methyl-D-erythritol 4-phosphate cytidylyltransferase/2-C-methyl-D-erythritol 2,4-cyclodiphosphate synthase
MLAGRSIIEWTIDAFRSTTERITVVAGAEDIDRLKDMVGCKDILITVGGQTRQDSVWNGLQTVEREDTIVLVHDAARPLVSRDLIERCVASAEKYGSGVAALPVVDALKNTIQRTEGIFTIVRDLDRDDVWAMQTPQAFDLETLQEAHILAREQGFNGPDEASLVQRLPGKSVQLVYGDRSNVKITTADDLAFAERQFASVHNLESRIGIGYDIHRLVRNRPLWLGGVSIESEVGLDGHSDADVILHAICDSLLGAAGLPDIGHLFPNTDPRYLGISSLTLLADVGLELKECGWTVGNVDTMVIAETPKISPYIAAMKTAISDALKTSADRISIKATTNEGIGSLGSGDGIACHATASITRSR